MRILGIGNYNELSYKSTHWLGHVQAFEELGHTFAYWHWDRSRIDEILNDIKDMNLDIIMLGVSSVFADDFLERLRTKTNAHIIWWYCDFADYEMLGDKNVIRRPVNKLIDEVFISNREQIPFYQKKLNIGRVHYLPQACLKRDKIEEPVREYVNELVFAGETSHHGIRTERMELLKYIQKECPQFRSYPNDDLKKEDSYGVHHLFYPSVKITLGQSWHNDADMYTSNRIFVVLGNGGFYLCNYFKNMEEVWDIGKHLDVFHTKEEAVDKIKYYSEHSEEREKIRRQGFEHAQKYHNYTVRIQNMIDIITGKTDDFYGYKRNITTNN